MLLNISNRILLLLLILTNCFLYADKIAVTTKVTGIAEIMKVGKKEFNLTSFISGNRYVTFPFLPLDAIVHSYIFVTVYEDNYA